MMAPVCTCRMRGYTGLSVTLSAWQPSRHGGPPMPRHARKKPEPKLDLIIYRAPCHAAGSASWQAPPSERSGTSSWRERVHSVDIVKRLQLDPNAVEALQGKTTAPGDGR